MPDADLAERTLVRAVPIQPRRWRILVLNDDYTPADFVVEVLESIFRMAPEKAVSVMIETHRRGVGVCGLFPRDVAETKTSEAMAVAAAAGHPLKFATEPVD